MLAAEAVAGVNRYLGYSAPTTASRGPGKGQEFTMGTNDEQRKYTSEQMRKMAVAAELCVLKGGEPAGVLGVKGMPSMFK
jgi:hypothetical protein